MRGQHTRQKGLDGIEASGAGPPQRSEEVIWVLNAGKEGRLTQIREFVQLTQTLPPPPQPKKRRGLII